jgi:hypothetical protein
METNYSIAIMGTNNDNTRASNKAWLNFSNPGCFFYYEKNLTKCGMYLLRLSQKPLKSFKIYKTNFNQFFYLEQQSLYFNNFRNM